MSKISTCATGAALTALSLISLAWADGPAARAPYAAGKTVSVGAPDRWDYLTFDPETHRLYLSHGDRVDVLDGRTGELLGKVTGIPGGTHGIGIVGAVG